jgi:hypothetical protein
MAEGSPASSEFCVPMLPEAWRHRYASMRKLASLLSKFMPAYREEFVIGSSNDHEREVGRSNFLLSLSALLTQERRRFSRECGDLWLMRTSEEWSSTITALAQLDATTPFTPVEQLWLADRVLEVRDPRNETVPRVIALGRLDLLDRWRQWLGEPSPELTADGEVGPEDGATTFAAACATLNEALDQALR